MRSFRFVLPLVASFALACASTPPVNYAGISPVTPGAGEKIGIDQVLLIVDSSSSLGPNGWSTARNGAVAFVDGMPNGNYGAGSIVFGGSERAGTSMAKFDRGALRGGLSSASYFGRNTPVADVLGEAYDELSAQAGDVAIVVFSDGVPTAGGITQPSYGMIEAGQRLVNQRPENRVCIHTVQVGTSAVGAANLERLAGLSDCGSQVTAANLASASTLSAFEKGVFFVGGAAPRPKAAPAGPSDADGDGVVDSADACPRTPRGASVNSRGCWVLKNLQFANDSAEIRPMYEPELNNVARVLRENPGLRIRVEGHTDSNGPAAYNLALSERRAKSVHDYLVKQGIADERIDQIGKGEAEPIASNDTAEGRAENRRIKLVVLD